MAARPVSRFDVERITLTVAGPQRFTADGHLTVSRAHRPRPVLAVTVGNLLAYCHDPAAIAAYATAWRVAADMGPRVLPATSTLPAAEAGSDVSLVLRLAGPPARQQVNGIPTQASPTGVPHVRVALDRLIVHALDLEAVRGWAEGWATAQTTAAQLWPDPDAFDVAEQADRQRIARRGTLTRP